VSPEPPRPAPAWTVHLPPGVRARDVDLLADGSLPARWQRRWRERGDAPQLQDVDGTWLSAGELERRSREAAGRLRAAGLNAGARLVLGAESSARFVVACVAALRAGLTVVPLNPAYPRPEVEAIVADCRPHAAAVESAQQAAWIRDVAGGERQVFGLDFERLGTEASDDALDRAGASDTALLIYTSGTTGRPKGVPLTHGNLLAGATAIALAWRWQPDDRLLLALPLFHVHGLGNGVIGSLCAGASVMLRAGFDPTDVAAGAQDGATLFFGVPTMYQRLVRSGQAPALRAMRLLVCGSAPLPAELAREIASRTGQMPLERYGMSETMMLAGNPYDGERRPGTVGFPFPGVDLRLAEHGEVQVRGPNVIDGYLDRPEATAEAFTSDGWFRTGDIGEFDGDGYLRLVGRSKELIISGGYNVFPREVEEALATHPAVREVAVVGRASEQWGEEVTAVVVAADEVTEDQLRGHARERLAPYKVPKRVEFVDELPRNALGKVVRGKL
jgi:malonyl-CoA/methylmalonyl-CoA synthetase